LTTEMARSLFPFHASTIPATFSTAFPAIATITRPRPRSAFAKIEPRIDVCATTTSPAESAEEDDEELGQVAERRLEDARRRRPPAARRPLGRERDDPRDAGERDGPEDERDDVRGVREVKDADDDAEDDRRRVDRRLQLRQATRHSGGVTGPLEAL
jgi:hypothetical protein